MRLLAFAGAAALLAIATSASGANLCNCCGASTAANCATACAPIKPVEGQCVAAIDYAGAPEIAEGQNPLYGMSLRNVWLGTPKRTDLEAFRRLLEAARRGAEKDRKAALRAYARKQIDQTEAARRAKRYDDAVVNYYLGLQSYRMAFSGG